MADTLVVAKARELIALLPQYANRHGLIAGATGTGKTVTLQRLAESFSRIGVPVFMADVKGDLAGISQPGEASGTVRGTHDGIIARRTQAPVMSPSTRSAYIGVACTLAGSIAFSGKPVIIKLAYAHSVDTMTLLALRMLFALPFFLLMAWWAGRPSVKLTRRDWGAIVFLGFIGYYLGSYLDLAGLQYISANLGRLILYLYPTIVLLISALYLKQRITAKHVVSLCLSYGGIALVFHAETALEGSAAALMLGAALVFASAVSYAVYLVAGARMIRKVGSMRFTAYASLAATVFVIATFMGTHGPGRLEVAQEVYVLVLVLAVFSTVVPLWFMAEGLKRIGANQASLVACIGPLATIGLGHAFLGEPITWIQLAGAALVLSGVVIISLKPEAQ